MPCGLVLLRSDKESKLHYFILLSSGINCPVEMPGWFLLLKCIVDRGMHISKLLSIGLHSTESMSRWILLHQPFNSAGLQHVAALPGRIYRADALPARFCLRESIVGLPVRTAQLLSFRNDATEKMSSWFLLPRSFDSR